MEQDRTRFQIGFKRFAVELNRLLVVVGTYNFEIHAIPLTDGNAGGMAYNYFIPMTETKAHRVEPDITVFAISGRLSLGNLLLSAEGAIRALIDSGARKLVIDLAGLDVIDSSGVGVLVSCAGHMEEASGQMRLAGAHGMVAKVFETIHIHRIVPLDADLDAACAGFAVRRPA